MRHLRRLEQTLNAGIERPAALIAAVSDGGRSGRSPGDTARLLEAFLVHRGLVLASDERGRLAHGRRARRIERCPLPLRPAAERYAAWLLSGRERARRVGEQPLTDHTIEQRLAVLAALAARLDRDGVCDWATCSRPHIEAFLATGRDRGFRLAALRNFFRFARQQRICLTDPTDGSRAPTRPRLPRPHPHPTRPGTAAAPLGSRRLPPARSARRTARAAARRGGQRAATAHRQRRQHRDEKVRLGRRPHPVPLDPLSFAALERCLAHRAGLGTENPHVIVTRGTRAHRTPASQPYLSHVLDPAGVTPRLLRQTRLAELTHRLDPRLVAAAFGMTPEGALHYLIGAVETEAAAFANL